ncbi:hypothetical protein C5B42_01900 [Candidatus Cerribacteria bacterium 'Amazon FNV 2010 28 9']|uniref:Sporulation stage II protein D amidase enhancer LytB N-terminal domain-containing protein n=1 Tax=Candidatus Cerribacteria bacterium 'Amazon FNV 2010 28 9' TaxID=2081795 RepID=A0A317JQS3_9BACT|nr:MAG: hypothetical protein C5B42_01900 [Candidatus Cerribacteria bacterium 'Amazon FNV 2010 28 9']
MRRRWLLRCLFLCCTLLQIWGSFLITANLAYADDIGDCNAGNDQACARAIAQVTSTMNGIASANNTNKTQFAALEQQISSIQSGINKAKLQSDALGVSIQQREATLGVTYGQFSERVVSSYKQQRQDVPLLLLSSGHDMSDVLSSLEYLQMVRSRDQQTLDQLSSDITQFETDKANLELTQQHLTSLQTSLNATAAKLKGSIDEANAAITKLSSQIAALSAQQQSIIAERTGTASTTVGDVPLADDPNASPTFNPGFSPAFAAFSFGAPHFKGMSQYGAFGRAKAGQSADDILHAYYGGGIQINKSYSTSITIRVDGYGSYNIEDYVKRIYEMPTSWADQGGFEALKAQAVAARSYALASTNNGASSICATESCQVFKPQDKGGQWDAAVDATRGWVLEANGQPFSAWYASTSGGYQQPYTYNGYTTPGFWDTTSDWTHWADGAYEAKAGSPWFYKGWYKSRSGDSCGRSHPWLTQDEFADILNAWIVRYQGNSDEVSHIQPLGPCWGSGGYSIDDMRNHANAYGGAFTSVSSVRVEHGNNGYTKNIIVDTNKGTVTIPADQFKTVFNLRAPGRLSIKGNLFGIEKK